MTIDRDPMPPFYIMENAENFKCVALLSSASPEPNVCVWKAYGISCMLEHVFVRMLWFEGQMEARVRASVASHVEIIGSD